MLLFSKPELANYRGERFYGKGQKRDYRQQTTPVGYFEVANAFGLSDMHGNVWEWCADDWHNNYEDAPNDGSAWMEFEASYLAKNNQSHSSSVLRGGSWANYPSYCRSAFRINDFRLEGRDYDYGFRVVCVFGSE